MVEGTRQINSVTLGKGGPQRQLKRGGSDCLLKTQDLAKFYNDV